MIKSSTLSVFAYVTLSFLLSGCLQPIAVDTIVHNATIYSLDGAETMAEAMALSDGKIIEIGAENQILNKYIADDKIDANNAFIYPGFIDAHSHFLGYGLTRNQVDLIGTKSWQEVVDRVQNHILEDSSEWILGRGWDQNDWENVAYPNNRQLDSLFPNKNIVLKRVDGHALITSSNVLELAGISNQTSIDGGGILFENGILIDKAMTLVTDIFPEPGNSQKANAFQRAEKDCLAKGLTSVCDAGLSVAEINLINNLHENEELKMRVYAMYSAHADILNSLSSLSIKTERLTANSVKVYADGSLGSRGAKLLNPYSDDTTHTGFMITPKDSITKWAEACYRDSFQLCVHCIGTSANRTTLDAMGRVLGGTNDRRWRIEHAQVVHPDDRSKFGQYNILPSMQPTHATSDMYWADERLGKSRMAWAYSLNTLMNENGLIPLGTDFPVENINPLHTFYAAVVRKDHEGLPADGFLFDESLSRLDALRGMTIWAAIANFEDSQKGTLEEGKVADFVILDQDILTCEEDNILSTKVLETWINGEQLYKD